MGVDDCDDDEFVLMLLPLLLPLLLVVVVLPDPPSSSICGGLPFPTPPIPPPPPPPPPPSSLILSAPMDEPTPAATLTSSGVERVPLNCCLLLAAIVGGICFATRVEWVRVGSWRSGGYRLLKVRMDETRVGDFVVDRSVFFEINE